MGLGEDRKTVLEKYGPYVRSLAATVRKQFNAQLELDELISYGQIGLLEAADRFDARMGANFLTFAHYRIKGAIFDGLRKMGILKGSDARSSYQSERATAYLGNLADRDQGGRGGRMEDDVREISDAVTGLAMVFATGFEAEAGSQMVDETLPPDQRIEIEQLRVRVKAAIEKLPEKERKLLQGYYFQGKTLEEAGAEIGQSKSWASRLHARAIERLKELLDDEDDNPQREPRRNAHGRSNVGDLGFADRTAKASGPGGSGSRQAGPVEVRRGHGE